MRRSNRRVLITTFAASAAFLLARVPAPATPLTSRMLQRTEAFRSIVDHDPLAITRSYSRRRKSVRRVPEDSHVVIVDSTGKGSFSVDVKVHRPKNDQETHFIHLKALAFQGLSDTGIPTFQDMAGVTVTPDAQEVGKGADYTVTFRVDIDPSVFAGGAQKRKLYLIAYKVVSATDITPVDRQNVRQNVMTTFTLLKPVADDSRLPTYTAGLRRAGGQSRRVRTKHPVIRRHQPSRTGR